MADLGDTRRDVGGLASAFDDGRVVLVNGDLLGGAQVLELDILKLDAQVLGDALAAGQDCDVLQHCLAAVAEARSLDGADLQRATQLVDDQGGERLAVHVLGDDQHWTAGLGDHLQQRQHVLEAGDLLLVDEDQRVAELAGHRVGVGDEVGGEVALVELHALDRVAAGVDGLGFLDGDGAVLADLLHGLGDDGADGGVGVGGDGGDLGDLLLVLHLDGHLRELLDNRLDCAVDAALEIHRIGAGGDVLQAFAVDCLGQDGGGGGAVARIVIGAAGNFLDHLGAHVLVGALQLDFLRDGDAVLSDERGTELLVNQDIASLGAEGDLDGLRQSGNTRQNRLAALVVILNLLCSHCFLYS